MNKLEIPKANIKLEYASCMDELTPEQFAHYCKLFVELKAGAINVHDFMLQMAVALLGIKVPWGYQKLYSDDARSNIESNLAMIMETLGWLLVEREEDTIAQVEPNLGFARNLIPQLGRCHGPGDALENITLGEFRDALGHSADFALTNDPTSIDKLCATLYRPIDPLWRIKRMGNNWNGDKRRPYNAATTDHRARYFAKLPYHLKFGAYLFFNASLNYLRNGSIIIEGKEIELAVLWQGGSSETPNIGMAGVLFSLAETGVFGSLKEVERVNLYEGLARLYQVVIQAPKPNTKPLW